MSARVPAARIREQLLSVLRAWGMSEAHTLHAPKRADPAQPVLVAGDPETATRAERLRDGVPVPADLMA